MFQLVLLFFNILPKPIPIYYAIPSACNYSDCQVQVSGHYQEKYDT